MSVNEDSNITRIIADYAARTSLDAVPEIVRERARLLVIDEIACSCFGARSAAGTLMAKYVGGIASGGESTILGTSQRAPAPLAALANGTSGHGEEVDGAHVVGGHPGATIVAAALAVAERQRATGADLINAVILGYDVGTRVLRACGGVFGVRERYELHSDFLFSIGAAVAAARLLGLDSTRHRYAMALATFQSNGLEALFNERRHLSKSFSNGQYAAAGVQSALMAAVGFEGSEDIIGGPHGLLAAWGDPDLAAATTDGLGTDFAVMAANFKFINAGYPTHAPVEAAVTLLKRHAIRLADIESVTVGMPSKALKVVDNRAMHNICVQDMVSAALAQGGLGIRATPFPGILSNDDYLDVRRRITATVDPELELENPTGRGARATIVLRDGRSFSERVDAPRGHSDSAAVTWSDLEEKWHDGLPDHDVDRILALGRNLDELEDVTTLTAALRSAS